MLCLDSSFLLDYLDEDRDGFPAAKGYVEGNRDSAFFAPAFVLFEVSRGAARLDGEEGVESLGTDLDWLEPLPFSAAAAAEAALVDAELAAAGHPVNLGDVVVAGTVRNAGGTLITSDSDFEVVEGLDVELYRNRT